MKKEILLKSTTDRVLQEAGCETEISLLGSAFRTRSRINGESCGTVTKPQPTLQRPLTWDGTSGCPALGPQHQTFTPLH